MSKWKNWKYEIEIDGLRIAQAIAEGGLFFFLALWEIGAMWTHIGGLKSASGMTKFLMYGGSLGTQFGMLILLAGSCFIFKGWVRVVCALLALACGCVILYHTGGIIAYDAAKAEGQATISAVGEQIRQNNKQAADVMKETIGEAGNAGGNFKSQNIRNATDGAQSKAAELAEKANQQLTELGTKQDALARAKTYFSEEYMNGWMYVVLFCAVFLSVGVAGLCIEGARYKADKNGNGHPDWAEPGHEKYDPSRAQRYWADYAKEAQKASEQYERAQEAERRLQEMQFNLRAQQSGTSPKETRH